MCIPSNDESFDCITCFPVPDTKGLKWICDRTKWFCHWPLLAQIVNLTSSIIYHSKYYDVYPTDRTDKAITYREMMDYIQPGCPLIFVRKATYRHFLFGEKRKEHWALFGGYRSGEPYVVHRYGVDNTRHRFPFDTNTNTILGRYNWLFDSVLGKIKKYIPTFAKYEKVPGSKAEIRTDNLNDVLQLNFLHCIKIGLCSPLVDQTLCRKLSLERAGLELGSHGYNLIYDNCETFIRFCNGEILPFSIQAHSILFTTIYTCANLLYLAFALYFYGRWLGILISIIYCNLNNFFSYFRPQFTYYYFMITLFHSLSFFIIKFFLVPAEHSTIFTITTIGHALLSHLIAELQRNMINLRPKIDELGEIFNDASRDFARNMSVNRLRKGRIILQKKCLVFKRSINEEIKTGLNKSTEQIKKSLEEMKMNSNRMLVLEIFHVHHLHELTDCNSVTNFDEFRIRRCCVGFERIHQIVQHENIGTSFMAHILSELKRVRVGLENRRLNAAQFDDIVEQFQILWNGIIKQINHQKDMNYIAPDSD